VQIALTNSAKAGDVAATATIERRRRKRHNHGDDMGRQDTDDRRIRMMS